MHADFVATVGVGVGGVPVLLAEDPVADEAFGVVVAAVHEGFVVGFPVPVSSSATSHVLRTGAEQDVPQRVIQVAPNVELDARLPRQLVRTNAPEQLGFLPDREAVDVDPGAPAALKAST